MGFSPQRVLITGAAGAIGGELAKAFASAWPQALRILVDRDEQALRERFREEPGRVVTETCDLTDIQALPGWWEAIVERHGSPDVLINCAGIMEIISFQGTGWELGSRILDINLTAPLRLMDLALPAMVEAGRGAVINVSSLAGEIPLRGCSYYGAAKAGIARASEIARAELAEQGVQVITVYPGPVYSGLESHARGQTAPGFLQRNIPTGKPDELAGEILRAFQRGHPRVIYPRIFRFSRELMQPGLPRRLIERFSPRPKK